MRKEAILISVIVIVGIGIAAWLLFKPPAQVLLPAPTPVPFSTQKTLQGCNEEATAVIQLMNALTKNDQSACPAQDSILRAYCRAALGKDTCRSIEREEDQAACKAIIDRNAAGCGDDGICTALAGGTAACAALEEDDEADCRAVINRDTAYFADPTVCAAGTEKIAATHACMNQASTPEEVEACLQS